MIIRPSLFISSMLITIYLYLQVHQSFFLIIINEDNFLSQHLSLLFLQICLTLFVILLIILTLSSFLVKNYLLNWFLYMYTLLIFHFAWDLTINLLALNNWTSFFLFTIYHPIPIEVKVHYLQMQLHLMCSHVPVDQVAFEYLTTFLGNNQHFNILYTMNACEIAIFAENIVLNSVSQPLEKGVLDILLSMPFAIILSFFSYSILDYIFLTNL